MAITTVKAISVPSKRLAASITSASTTIELNNILGWDGVALAAADFGTRLYAILRNDANTLMEIMELDPATIASASITVTRRGLKFNGHLTTEVTANKLTWVKNQTIVEIGTDAPQLLESYIQYIDTQMSMKRVVVTTQSATPAINTDNTDVAYITGLAQAVTSFTTNLTGTPVNGQVLIIDITDNGTGRALTFGASFEASGTVPLPTTTVASTKLTIAFRWNTVTSKWTCVGIA